jgi:hypothetical protein
MSAGRPWTGWWSSTVLEAQGAVDGILHRVEAERIDSERGSVRLLDDQRRALAGAACTSGAAPARRTVICCDASEKRQ